MRTVSWIGATIMACAALAPGAPPPNDVLLVRIAQAGFVGVTGRVYRVEPGGRWTLRTFINDQFGEIESAGSLSADQADELGEFLAPGTLSACDGGPASVNPASVEVTYQTESFVAFLEPGAEIGDCCLTAECSVLRLGAWLETELGGR